MHKPHQYILIIAGGVGSRFWPASRETMPKQFLDILGTGKSLIRMSFERATQIVTPDQILIATHKNYKSLVMEHLPEISEQQILLEPSRNNTAPCIAYAALKLQDQDPEAVFAVLPSDHVILKEVQFAEKIHQAFEFAQNNDALITLGIQPTRADTGYGYIQKGEKVDNQSSLYKVKRFTEKPNLKTAAQFLQSGEYLWNAGIFIWSVESVLNAFQKNEAQIIEVLTQEADKLNTKAEQEYINRVYPQTNNISVDFALMEKSSNVFTIPADIGWSDLGTWNSLYSFLIKKGQNNVLQTDQSVILEADGNLIRSKDTKLVVIKGLKNYIVVDDDDVLLIYPRDDEQEIKTIRNSLKDRSFQ